jgi:hypothetical protein
MDPHYPVAVHVIYDRDIGEPFSVTGLIYANAAEVVHPYRYIGFYSVMGGFDAVPDCPPVDVFKQRDSCLGHPADHPGDFIIEVFCKAALAICPWDEFCLYTVFGAFDPFWPVADVNRNTIKVWGTPCRLCTVFSVIPGALPSTDRTAFLHSLIRSCMDIDPGLLVGLTKTVYGDSCLFTIGDMHTIMVEIEHSF